MEAKFDELDKLINLNKKTMDTTVDKLVDLVKGGFADSIDALVYAKKGVELFSLLEKQIRPIAEENIRLAKGEVYSKYNAEISQKQVGTKYDFTVCQDSEWDSLKAAYEKADTLLKEREKFLKTVTKPLHTFNEETGETFTINPPVKTGKMGIAISLK